MLNLSFVNNNPPALNAQNMNAIVQAINTLDTQIASPFNYKGVVADVASLPASGNTVNDTYYVTAETCLYSWNGSAWSQSSLEESDYLEEISEIKNSLPYTNNNAEDYEHGPLLVPYDKRIFLYYRTGTVTEYDEVYMNSSRAISRIPDTSIIGGTLVIYNPDKYPIGVYKRNKIDNKYEGYHRTVTTIPCIVVTALDTATYSYYAIAVHGPNGAETNWPASELDEMTRNVFIYSGEYHNNQESIGLTINPNLITPDIIHIGKYYHGSSQPSDNPNMAYTDLIPIKEKRTYYFPYLTFGYSWYGSDGTTVIGGAYTAVETVAERTAYITLNAPTGACFIGVSVRSGDVENMVLSELPNSKPKVDSVAVLPIACSKIVREPLNWLYNMDFKWNRGGSRLYDMEISEVIYDGEKVTIGVGDKIVVSDQIAMDKSKMSFVFSVPSGQEPNFVVGDCGFYSKTPFSISDGSIGVQFRPNGTMNIRMGTGELGNYATSLSYVDVSSLDIYSGRKFVVTIEKDTINKYIVSVYDALCPSTVIETTVEASVNPSDDNLYIGQIRGWGGPFVYCHTDTVSIYSIKMYSTSPTYPKVAIWGDSYVEGMGRNPACTYANLMRDALDGNMLVSGQGGATAEQTSYRVAAEINACAPQYIIFNVGVNDSFNVSVDTFKTQLQRLIDMAEAKGAQPILVTVPNVPSGTSSVAAFCEAVNPWIRSLGYEYIDIAYALSTGDGVTGDVNKFVADRTHPNLAGGQAIFNYIKAHLPQLLWK